MALLWLLSGKGARRNAGMGEKKRSPIAIFAADAENRAQSRAPLFVAQFFPL
jgi:hypothetical protein